MLPMREAGRADKITNRVLSKQSVLIVLDSLLIQRLFHSKCYLF